MRAEIHHGTLTVIEAVGEGSTLAEIHGVDDDLMFHCL